MEKERNNFGIYWTKEEEDILRKLVEVDKLNYDEISIILNRTKDSIMTRISHLNLNYFHSNFKSSDWTGEDIDILREEISKGTSWPKIAKLPQFIGRHSENNIRFFYNKYKDQYNFQKERNQLDKATVHNCIEEYSTGMYSIQEVAKRNNINPGSLISLFKRRNIQVLTKKEMILKTGYVPGHPGIFITKELLEKEICIGNKTAKDLAKEFNIATSVILKRMKLFNLEFPKNRESNGIKVVINPKKDYKRNPRLRCNRCKDGYSKRYELLKKYLGEDKVFVGEYMNLKVAHYLPKETLFSLWKEGKSLQEIGKIMGLGIWDLSYQIIHEAFKFHKIKTKIDQYDQSFWEKHFIIEGASLEDLSELTGFSVEHIRKYLSKLFPNRKFLMKGTYGEKVTQRSLIDLNLDYKRQYNLDPGIVRENNKVIIDFRVIYNKKEYWIEYQGIQHYKFNENNYRKGKKIFGNPEIFLEQQKRDNDIRKYCSEEDIVLIEIPYTIQSTKKVKNILKRIILDNKSPEEVIDLSRFFQEIEKSLQLINKLENNEEI